MGLKRCSICGRSFPDNQGDICKICSMRQSKSSPSTDSRGTPKFQIKPGLASASSPVKKDTGGFQIKKEVNPPTPSTSPSSFPPKTGQPQTYPGRTQQQIDLEAQDLSAMAMSPGGISRALKPKDKEPEFDVCPKCNQEQTRDGIAFCEFCGAMLHMSDGKVEQDFPLSKMFGVTTTTLDKLKGKGITTTRQLLAEATTPGKRKALSIKAGLNESAMLRMINHADLTRIEGITLEQTAILEIAGVNSIIDLRSRTPKQILERINAHKSALQKLGAIVMPIESQLVKWIEEAKKIEPTVK